MATFPVVDYLRNAARTEAEQKDAFEAWLAATKQLPGGQAATTLTLASDQITPTGASHLVDTQSGAASDNLAQILQTNLPDGSRLMLGIVSNARVVVVKHNAGGAGTISLVNGVDFTIDNTTTFLLIQRNGTVWEERDRSYGTAATGHRAFYGLPGLTVPNAFTQRQLWAKGADLTAGATITPGVDGNFFHLVGTGGPITAIASLQAGARILLMIASASVQFTHNPTSLILAGSKDYVTQFPGEMIEFVSEGSGNWRQAVAGQSSSGGDLITNVEFHEDFIGGGQRIGATDLFVLPSGIWRFSAQGGVSWQADMRGVIRIATSSGIIGPYADAAGASPLLLLQASQNPTLTFRCSGTGAAGSSRFVGAFSNLAAPPTHGIYVRWDNANFIAVCRSSSAESTLDTGLAVDTNMHVFRFAMTASVVTVYIDGVARGTITDHIPSAVLQIAAYPPDVGHTLDIDYFNLRTQR